MNRAMGQKYVEKEVVIEGLNSAGHGCAGRLEVPHTVIGDRVIVQQWGRRKGRVVRIVEEGADRITTICPHAHECGGCRWQQMGYCAQLRQKFQHVQKLFSDHYVHPILPSRSIWRHRGKMEFSFSQDRSGQRFLGLYSPFGRGRVTTIQECFQVSPWFQETLDEVRHWWQESGLEAFHPHRGEGALRTLTLREGKRTGDHLAILTVNGAVSIDGLALSSLVIRRQYSQSGVPTRFTEEIVSGKGVLEERLVIAGRSLRFLVSPSAFFQPNSEQAEVLYEHCLSLARLGPTDQVLDLCCGTGTLSLAAALKAKKVMGIEIVQSAIEDARRNAELNGISNVQFELGDVDALVSGKWDVVLIDPPRAGLPSGAIKQIIACAPSRVVYMSCNPLTQATDVQKLIAHGYVVTHVQPIDQFPHTPHVENLVALEQRSKVG